MVKNDEIIVNILCEVQTAFLSNGDVENFTYAIGSGTMTIPVDLT